MAAYDFIFAGGGLAGLSLAYALAHSPLRDASLLIVDRDPKERNDRTWCFWAPADRPTPFDGLATRTWRRLRVAGPGWQTTATLDDFRYQMIRGVDFYRIVREHLTALPNVTWLQASVSEIDDQPRCASVTADGTRHLARWVFDSRFNLAAFRPAAGRYHALRQHFKGWLIEAQRPTFDPAVPTLMDFRTPQQGGLRFFYVLPLSPTRALVELVSLKADLADDDLHAYARAALGLPAYRIVAREGGVSPLTDHAFPRRSSPHVLRIGTAGGRVKPSSGYAFTRIQQDTAAIVRSLARRGHPFDLPAASGYYRLCDALLLDLMQHRPRLLPGIFRALFQNNPLDRVLRFLDEAASPVENARLIASLPPQPFLRTLWTMPGRASLAALHTLRSAGR